MSTPLRRLGALVAAAALLAGLGTGAASAAISTAEFCANVEPGSSGFTDISTVAGAQRTDIECLAASKITSGTSATTYAPTASVSRAAMATFVATLIDRANALETQTLASLPTDAPDAFGDDEGIVHEDNINRLAAAAVVQGTSPTTFSPSGNVTRGQMATFLVAALDYLRPESLPAGADVFTDDEGNAHESNINKLAAIDVVDGVGATSYNPNGQVSRAQMASFLVRTLAFLHDQGEIAALPPTTQSIVVNPATPVTNATDAADGDDVPVTASNIAVADVDVRLFPCENVSVTQGVVRFVDEDADGAADAGADLVEADIETVNGTDQAADTESASGVAVTSGAIGLTVDSPSADCVVAVVWDDADDDDAVDLDSERRPSEDFGRSGAASFVPPPAASGGMDENVESVGAGSFVGCEIGGPLPGAGDFPEEGPNAVSTTDCFVFRFDSNDVFTIQPDQQTQAVAATLAEFAAALSPGDDVTGTYDADSGDQSSFNLIDEDVPAVPADETAPKAVDTRLTTDAGTADRIDVGDVIQLCFDDEMTDPAADGNIFQPNDEVLVLEDADGTEATLTDGGNATFRRGDASVTTIEVEDGNVACDEDRAVEVIIGGGALNAEGGDDVLDFGATFTLADNLEDDAGNEFAAGAGGQDVVVNEE
jgi:hypothetical protein